MLRMKSVSMFTLLILFNATALSVYGWDEGKIDISTDACAKGISDETIVLIAKQVNSFDVSEEVDACLHQLPQENKVRIFEVMAEEKGISIQELREDAEGMKQASEGIKNPSLGTAWTQPIERTIWINIWTSVSPNAWWPDQYTCDGTPDTDYMFQFTYNSPITNPDGLRTWSDTNAFGGWNVQLMLEYYQSTAGGLKGIGNTSSSTAKLCVGDTGYWSAGGYVAIMSALRLQR